MFRYTTDCMHRPPKLADRLCSFGLTEVVLPIIASTLVNAGVGATTAGVIASVATPALIGAGTGALTSAVTGGDPGKGALYGGISGGAFGGAGAAFPETAASISGALGPTASGALGGAAKGALTQALAGGDVGQGALYGGVLGGASGYFGAPDGAGNGFLKNMFGSAAAPQGALSGAQGQGMDSAGNAIIGDPWDGGPMAGGAASPLVASSGAAAKGLSGTAKAMGALSLLGSFLGKDAKPNYGVTPGPETTAATRGPYFDQPLDTVSHLNRTINENYMPAGNDWYTYGQRPQQPSFYSNNQLHLARGGALSAARGPQFDSGRGDSYVRGEGDGQEDGVPARLSQSEYVLTAADVSRIGQGSSEAGARKLDQMRARIARDAGAKKHQGRVKSPLQYLREAS